MSRLVLVALAALILPSSVLAQAKPGKDDPKAFEDQVRPFLVKHCLACHGMEKPKGDLRLDRLGVDFGDAASRKTWQRALERVRAGEMPPKGKPRPSEKEVAALADWVHAR